MATSQMAEALEKARRRGLQTATMEWKKDENLTLADFAAKLGVDDVWVAWANRTGQVYGLCHPEHPEKVKYPSWQVEAPKDRLHGALKPFRRTLTNQWVVHTFMLRPNEDLGMTPIEYVCDKALPMDKLIRLIEVEVLSKET